MPSSNNTDLDMANKKAFWISYDLGLSGDYKSLYEWLDSIGAKECGNNIAFFNKEYAAEDIPEAVKEDLMTKYKPKSTDRIYLIYLKSGKMKGNFLFGGRKRALWEGYWGSGTMAEDSDE